MNPGAPYAGGPLPGGMFFSNRAVPDETLLSHSDRAYLRLRRAIATAALPPGAVFNEREEAAKLGMSRTPFRQAVHRLAADGLVVTIPQKGIVVRPLSVADLEDSYWVRECVEPPLLRRTIESGNSIDDAELIAAQDAMEEAEAEGDYWAFMEADEHYHLLLAIAGESPRCLEVLRQAWLDTGRCRYLTASESPSMRAALREHKRITRSALAHDAAGSETAMLLHLRSSRARAVKLTHAVLEPGLASVEEA